MPEHSTPDYHATGYLVKRLFGEHIRPHAAKLSLAIICMLIVAASTAGLAYLMEPVIDDIFVNQNKDMLFFVASAIIVVHLVKGVASFGQSYFLIYVTQRVATDLQMKLYRHLLHADINLIAGEKSGTLVSRFSNDFQILRSAINVISVTLARELFSLIFLVSLMFYQSTTLALIAFVAFPLAIYPILRLGKRMRKISTSTQVELGRFSEHLSESFQSAPVIKAYQQEETEASKASGVVERIFTLYVKAARVRSLASPMIEMLSGFAVAAVVWFGGLQVMEGTTTSGSFFSFMTAALLAYKPAKSLSSLNSILQEGLGAAKRIFVLYDTEPLIKDKETAKPLKFKGGEVAFHNVNFAYENGHPILKNLSFEARKGQTIALVGASGGGKSTIINLIQRFYDPQSGTITIDGQNISDVTLTSLREKMALVSQHVTLFDDSVAANIAYGKPNAPKEEIKQAAIAAAAHEFIEALPNGYDTMIGQNGFKLSGGQRQRLSIARAMLRNAPILLLDEATSALDSLSEKKIQQALERLMEGRTTLLIAHRLTTVEHADQILVIQNGQVMESGTHHDLLRANGAYTKLHSKLV